MQQLEHLKPGLLYDFYNDSDDVAPPEGYIFVFGSNLSGAHGKGAARHAVSHYGAVYGVARGLQGEAYAIPTKDKSLRVRSLEEIAADVDEFVKFTHLNPDKRFLVTAVGCGLAGLTPEQMAPMFRGVVNCWLPMSWKLAFLNWD